MRASDAAGSFVVFFIIRILPSEGQQISDSLTCYAETCPQPLRCPLSAQTQAYIKMAVRSARTSMDADECESHFPDSPCPDPSMPHTQGCTVLFMQAIARLEAQGYCMIACGMRDEHQNDTLDACALL